METWHWVPSDNPFRDITKQDAVDSIRNKWMHMGKQDLGDVPIHAFEKPANMAITSNTIVAAPGSEIDATKPFLVGCYQFQRKPWGMTVTIMGVCPLYRRGMRARELTFDLQEAFEMNAKYTSMPVSEMPVAKPLPPPLAYVRPDFFVFKGRPVFPTHVEGKQLYDELFKFFAWMKQYAASSKIVPYPLAQESTSADALFYLFLMAVYDNPLLLDYWIGLYKCYLRAHLRSLIPTAEERLHYAHSMGLDTTNPDEVDQKLTDLVHKEVARLRDEKELWAPRVPVRLSKYFYFVKQWFPFADAVKDK
jgi:hypothetical protein